MVCVSTALLQQQHLAAGRLGATVLDACPSAGAHCWPVAQPSAAALVACQYRAVHRWLAGLPLLLLCMQPLTWRALLVASPGGRPQ